MCPATLELYVKYLKEGQHCRFLPSLKKESIKSLLVVAYHSMFWKLGETIKTSSFHLSNFEKILGSRTRCAHGSRFSLSWLAFPTHPSRASYKVRFLITWHHSLFKALYLLRKLGRLCLLSHKDRGLGLTPWFHLFYITNDFAETIPSNTY